MNLEAKILSLTYKDRVDIYRSDKTKDENGITSIKKTLLKSGVKCALSKKDLSTVTSDVVGIVYDSNLFCTPDIDIKTGDYLEIRRMGHIYKVYAGNVFYYPSHLEVQVTSRERV